MLHPRHVALALALAATPAAFVSPAAAQEAEVFAVQGTHTERGAYEGEVRLTQQGGRLEVTRSVRYADGRSETHAGRGTRNGNEVRATLQPNGGAAAAVEGLTTPAIDDRRPLELHLQLRPFEGRWRSRVVVGGAEVARDEGRGETRTDVPLVGRRTNSDGTVREDRATGYERFVGVPFVKAEEDSLDIHESDPRQGSLGNCYMMAALVAVARANPERIRGMIRQTGEERYEITLHGAGRFGWGPNEGVEIDQRFPTNGSGPAYAKLGDKESVNGETRHELWPMMIERAIAQHEGGYDKIWGGWPQEVFRFTGGRATQIQTHAATNAADLRRRIEAALAAGHPVCVSFVRGVGAVDSSVGLIDNHSYGVSVAADGTVTLRNPWGSSHPSRPLKIEELIALGATIDLGQ